MILVPAVMFIGFSGEDTSLGKALTGSGALVEGHETMNGAASVYTSFKLNGTSNGEGKGLCFKLARM